MLVSRLNYIPTLLSRNLSSRSTNYRCFASFFNRNDPNSSNSGEKSSKNKDLLAESDSDSENIKDVSALEMNWEDTALELKQNEQSLLEDLDDDPTNECLKMSAATAGALRRVITNEINDYKQAKAEIDRVKFDLINTFTTRGFLLLENAGEPMLQLVKHIGPIKVDILFLAKERHHILQQDDERSLYYHELDLTPEHMEVRFENPSFNVMKGIREKIARDTVLHPTNPLGNPLEEYIFSFCVVVSKHENDNQNSKINSVESEFPQEKYMVYECEEAYGEITIQSITMHSTFTTVEDILHKKELKQIEKYARAVKPSTYTPNFVNLSEVLQKSLLEYMQSFQIDIELVHSMHRASVFKRQNLFVEWLHNTHNLTTEFHE